MKHNSRKAEIRLAREVDLDGWMALVASVRESFPGLETPQALEDHRNAVVECICRESAVCAVTDGRVVGALLFSRDQGELCFLAVAPECRRQHIARELFTFMLTRMEPGRDISVTTYRTGDPRGAAARAFYQKMGFTEGPLSEAFGCPVQEFLRKG